MKEAVSMYFGGAVISAEDCDYQTSRELGLKCPFCSSAVFVRSQSVRQTKKGLKLFSPYFAHYPSGVQDNWDCENRAKTAQGRERIERLKIQARDQRLTLYNRHLWEMVRRDRNISKQKLKTVAKTFGTRWCEITSVLVRREMGLCLSDMYTLIDAAVQGIANTSDLTPEEMIPTKNLQWVDRDSIQEEIEKQSMYLLSVDKTMHLAICTEIVEFLSTNTGGYAFHNIFKASLILSVISGMGMKEIKQEHPRFFLGGIAGFIAGTHWVEQINKQLENKGVAHV